MKIQRIATPEKKTPQVRSLKRNLSDSVIAGVNGRNQERMKEKCYCI
jgi:hypothetical protein